MGSGGGVQEVQKVRWVQGVLATPATTSAVARLVRSGPGMPGWRSHTEIIAWQLANELKLALYGLIRTGPVSRDFGSAARFDAPLAPPRVSSPKGTGAFCRVSSSNTCDGRTES